MATSIKEIKRFNKDRGLHEKTFDVYAHTTNMIEELFEMHGVHDNEDRDLSLLMKDSMRDMINLVKSGHMKQKGIEYIEPTTDSIIDALNDQVVFPMGEQMKLGYDPDLALAETAKEINSRIGSFSDGKFHKDKSEEAQALWYEADYSKCKL